MNAPATDERPARKPIDTADAMLGEQVAFLTDTLPPPPARILDAGCGRGQLTQALRQRRYEVTAIDSDAEVVAAARADGVEALHADIADYRDGPFDAVVFSLSLHHVDSVDAAVARAGTLLRSDGLLVLDEFAWDWADRAAAAWFYDVGALLAAAGLLQGDCHDASPENPLAHWRRHHGEHERMNSGTVMVEAVARQFHTVDTARVPYLYRYLSGWATKGVAGAEVFTVLRDIERRRIADRSQAAIGLHVVARRKP